MCCGMYLSVDICDTNSIGIYNGKFAYTSANKAFSAPTPNSAYPKNDDILLRYLVHSIFSQKQFSTLENSTFNTHINNQLDRRSLFIYGRQKYEKDWFKIKCYQVLVIGNLNKCFQEISKIFSKH